MTVSLTEAHQLDYILEHQAALKLMKRMKAKRSSLHTPSITVFSTFDLETATEAYASDKEFIITINVYNRCNNRSPV